jgi:site-specific recombinase XerD
MTFASYLADRGLAPSTATLYERIVARIPDDQDPEDWLVNQVAESTPPGTRASLRGAVVNLVRWRSGDPEAKLDVVLPRSRRAVVYGRDALPQADVDEYERLLDEGSIPEPSRTVLRLLAHTGLRISEMCGLRWDAIELRGDPPGCTVVGKGNKERWIPLTGSAKAILAEYKRDHEPAREGPWVFPAARCEGPTSAAVVRSHLRALRGSAKTKRLRTVHPHLLRHTVATKLLARGVNLKVVQVVLGHADIATTSIYLHPTRDMIFEAFAKL